MDFGSFNNLGKILIFIGIGIVVIGGIILLFSEIPFFGKLPGDIFIKKENFSLYFPIISSIILSIIITVIINIVIRIFMKK